MMLTGLLLIDNVDVYSNYGLYVKNYAPLLTMPQYKSSSITTTDWHESDGLDADLSAPVLDGRQFQLQFHLAHPNAPSDAQVLLSDLTSQVYHTFNFPVLGKTHTLRLVTNPSFAQNARFDTLSLTFAEDAVTIPTVAVPTQETGIPLGYIIDDADFALYGCTVVKGTRDSFLKFGQPKEALKRSFRTVVGINYDSGDTIHLKTRDITVNLHMRTATVAEFWARWYALWNAVLKIDTAAQTLTDRAVRTIEGDGMTFRCYYKSSNPTRFLLLEDGGVWCDFSITFSVLSYSRGDEWFYLTWQDGTPVIFEDDNPSDIAHYIRIR